MSYIVSLFREEIKQLVVEVIAGLYYCDEEGTELVIAKILSIYWLFGCHLELTTCLHFLWETSFCLFPLFRVHPQHYLLLIAGAVIAWILDVIYQAFDWFSSLTFFLHVNLSVYIINWSSMCQNFWHLNIYTVAVLLLLGLLNWIFQAFIIIWKRVTSDIRALFQLDSTCQRFAHFVTWN